MPKSKPRRRRRDALVPIDLVKSIKPSAFPAVVEIVAASGEDGAVLTFSELARRAHTSAKNVKKQLADPTSQIDPFGTLWVVDAEERLRYGKRFRLSGVPAKSHFVAIPYSVRRDVYRATSLGTSNTTAGVALKAYAGIRWYYRPGGKVFPGIETVAAQAGLQRRSIERGLAVLESVGAITRKGRFGRTNLYEFP